jgi:hypothetical protein
MIKKEFPDRKTVGVSEVGKSTPIVSDKFFESQTKPCCSEYIRNVDFVSAVASAPQDLTTIHAIWLRKYEACITGHTGSRYEPKFRHQLVFGE